MMTKNYYSEYAGHCLRFYFKNKGEVLIFKSDADAFNWQACETALNTFTDERKRMYEEIYTGDGTVAENVLKMANKLGVGTGYVWKEIKDLERKVAILRGLI